MIAVQLRVFGAFRKYFDQGTLEIKLKEEQTIASFKKNLQNQFKLMLPSFSDEKLILESAIASDDEILSEDFIINKNLNLAILPPVCGG